MKIAYKPYSSFPNSFEIKAGINPDWPAEMMEVDDKFSKAGWTVVTSKQYKDLLDSMADEKESFNSVVKNVDSYLEKDVHYDLLADGGKRITVTTDSLAALLKSEVEKLK